MSKTAKLTSRETADVCGACIRGLVQRSNAEFDLVSMAAAFGKFCQAYGITVDPETIVALAWEANLERCAITSASCSTGQHTDHRRHRATVRDR